ncbi:MAG: signal recognition particle-docking protein FtsY, partial [Syntrophaceticus sp.]|nr:signal recognition particle-docking protein FtsY [Syntrophaceticus sp.]MDD4782570.1 signal recognition particle-docking protein FtsY [Syntrophaceticus sp.]
KEKLTKTDQKQQKSKLKETLTKTRESFVSKVKQLVTVHKKIDEELYEELEDILLQADVGVAATCRLMDEIRQDVKKRKISDAADLRNLLQGKMKELLGEDVSLQTDFPPPTVILVVGVNGVGKTTTIGKLAYRMRQEGKSVLMVAADTYRAAAIEQLEIWSERADTGIIKHMPGSDPAAVVFDAIQAAKKRDIDVVIIDTAGRLHTKVNLMEELKKVRRVITRELPDAPHEVLLVIDAATGQNAMRQAELFKEATDITGIALTKLDGTAKGGIVFAISEELGIPVKLVGTGEGIDDLDDFDSDEFVSALFADDEEDEYDEYGEEDEGEGDDE